MKMLFAGASALAVAVVVAAGTIAYSQQSAVPGRSAPGQGIQPSGQSQQACLTQYNPMPGQSAITMIRAGYEIKAAVPNGLWLQKDKDLYYCNSGRPVEGDVQCWQMREVTRC
ncbi:hypothetical protein LJ725_19975 [Reyranella aquatilis]|uniref:Uncharacterized protein n=1 Tax=Reyranella aquatilis TaxID=2035356 RepID=A0ABS8KYS9_9HYPH|nr:hypothetical protein [Reyranella aquatilis]MCC8431259.1 hypothetical protein [Reyranella aquatilis]